MTTLVANIAVDMGPGLQQQLQQFFVASDLVQDSSTTQSAKYHSASLNMSVEVAGVNLTYITQGTLQFVNGGTINGFEVDSPIGTLGYKFSGYSATPPNLIDLAGADTLNGSPFADVLAGLAGADTLIGGKGRDLLAGGADNDTFDFNSKADSKKGALHRDVIGDFSGVGGDGDHIDLAGIDANSARHGNQAFKFIGAAKFHHKAGELQVSTTL
jgi:Ca2+-binding RTX toxin-like protein